METELIKNKYIIKYIYNDSHGVFARIFELKSLEPGKSPNIRKPIGILTTYFEKIAQVEDGKAHWTAECYLIRDYVSKDLIDVIGIELLKNTSCEEPLLLEVVKGDSMCDEFREYGQLYNS